MWFEILPAALIIVAAHAVPIYANYGINWLILGNGYRRTLDERFQRGEYMRDGRIAGHYYRLKGLETIPDEKTTSD